MNIRTPEAKYCTPLDGFPGNPFPIPAQFEAAEPTVENGNSRTVEGGLKSYTTYQRGGNYMMPQQGSNWFTNPIDMPAVTTGMPSQTYAAPPSVAPTMPPPPVAPPLVPQAYNGGSSSMPPYSSNSQAFNGGSASTATAMQGGMQMPGAGQHVQFMMPGGYPVTMMMTPQGQMVPVNNMQMPSFTQQAAAQMQHLQMPVQGQRLRLNSLLSGAQPVASHGQMFTAPSAAQGREPQTTVMLRNIPQKFDREMLLTDLDNRGFKGLYDFFYLPVDFNTTNSMGYAFINFVSEPAVGRFRELYTGLRLSDDSAKICEVSDAKTQGKARNLEYYRNSSVMGMDEAYHAVSFENGNRVPFPKPTRALKVVQQRAPRAW